VKRWFGDVVDALDCAAVVEIYGMA